MKNTQRAALAALALSLALAAGVWLWRGIGSQRGGDAAPVFPQAATSDTGESETEMPREPPPGLSEYRSERYGFSLFYQEDLTSRDID